MERHAPHKAGLQSFKEGLNDRIVCCLTGNCEANAEKGSNDLSDQGSQFTSHEWREFLSDHNLEASMSRRGNCYDNAVAESFFHLLKTERIKRTTYKTRTDARQDVFDYIEIFYNPKRRHANKGMLSPVEYAMTTK